MAICGYRYQFTFNAMHNLVVNDPRKMHAHSFRVGIYIEIEEYQFEHLHQCEIAIKNYLKRYEGIRLNELQVFQKKIPSIENICEVLYRDIKQLVETYDMKLCKLEFGDNPLATYSISEGEDLLVGNVNNVVKKRDYLEYQEYIKQHYHIQ